MLALKTSGGAEAQSEADLLFRTSTFHLSARRITAAASSAGAELA